VKSMNIRGRIFFVFLISLFVQPASFGEGFKSRVRAYLPADCEQLLQNYDELISGDNFIAFYGRKLPFFEFSNFWRDPIIVRNKIWPTSEHYFQAMKFEGTSHEEEIRNNPEPKDIADMGRDRSRPLRPDWLLVKERIMLEAVYAKFSQNTHLRELLLSTGDKILIEHTENDEIWGDKLDGTGTNKLGIILMVVRDVLRNESGNPLLSIPEFLFIKYLAEQQGYQVSLTGNEHVGDSRNYDINALRKSIRDPLSAESRLKIAYKIGTRETLLKSTPWEMRDDETTYNEIRLSISRPDGSLVTPEARSEFENQVYQGLAKQRTRAPVDYRSEDFALLFYERPIETGASSRQPSLITNGLKLASASESKASEEEPSGRLYGKFKIRSVFASATEQFPELEMQVGQDVELQLSEDGNKIDKIKIGEFEIGQERIFADGRSSNGWSLLAYVNDRSAFRLQLPPKEMRGQLTGKPIYILNANRNNEPIVDMRSE
jgi:N-glycosidase YbiA